ncbi:Hypothetical predicted protein, partial [Mytilus galloprovincialis]
LGYSVFLIDKLLEKYESKNIHLMYDIACILDKQLKKYKVDVLDRISLSIPIFQCFGHKFSCQVIFNPRKTLGIGLTDGEGMERLWSYLGKFSSITKEMTPENRIDLLTDALIYYGQKKKQKLGASLVTKIEKSKKLLETSEQVLKDLLSPFQGTDKETIGNWLNAEIIHASSKQVNVDDEMNWKHQYVMNLEKLFSHRAKIDLYG